MDEKKSNNKSRFKVTMKKRKVNKVTEGEERNCNGFDEQRGEPSNYEINRN